MGIHSELIYTQIHHTRTHAHTRTRTRTDTDRHTRAHTHAHAHTHTLHSHLLSFQQPPVGGDLHLQGLLDAQQLLVLGLVALHVQPQLGQLVLQLAQGVLQTLHLHRVLVARVPQVSLQNVDLKDTSGEPQDRHGAYRAHSYSVR